MATFIQTWRSQSYLDVGPPMLRISFISFCHRPADCNEMIHLISFVDATFFTKLLPSDRLETPEEGQSEETA